jgi:hypothetical protein
LITQQPLGLTSGGFSFRSMIMAPTNDSLDMGLPSPCPDIRGMKHTAAVEAMVAWFLANFEDPAERTPWNEGEYVFIWGGPCCARDELEHTFGGVATDRAIAAAVIRIEEDGIMWVPSGSRMQECD